MIYTPPSRPKGRSRTGNLPVRVVFYGFFCRHGDKAPLFCFVRRMISAQAAKGGRPAGEPPLCSLCFSALSPGGSFLPAGIEKRSRIPNRLRFSARTKSVKTSRPIGALTPLPVQRPFLCKRYADCIKHPRQQYSLPSTDPRFPKQRNV